MEEWIPMVTKEILTAYRGIDSFIRFPHFCGKLQLPTYQSTYDMTMKNRIIYQGVLSIL